MWQIKAVIEIEDIRTVEQLATLIWHEHYTPIIGSAQVVYMLEKYQSLQAMQQQMAEGTRYFLIRNKQESIGYFSVQSKSDSLFLSKLYVLKSYRAQGVGKTALNYMEGLAKTAGLNNISLTVNKYNTHTIKTYERMGFSIVDAVVNAIGNGFVMDDYLMLKSIE